MTFFVVLLKWKHSEQHSSYPSLRLEEHDRNNPINYPMQLETSTIKIHPKFKTSPPRLLLRTIFTMEANIHLFQWRKLIVLRWASRYMTRFRGSKKDLFALAKTTFAKSLFWMQKHFSPLQKKTLAKSLAWTQKQFLLFERNRLSHTRSCGCKISSRDSRVGSIIVVVSFAYEPVKPIEVTIFRSPPPFTVFKRANIAFTVNTFVKEWDCHIGTYNGNETFNGPYRC